MFNRILSIDPGYSVHPTGTMLVEVQAPDLAVRDGQLVERAEEGDEQDASPSNLPAHEVAQPHYAVLDVQSRKHLDPKAILREAIEVESDLGGGLAVVVDCGGVGHGLWLDLREVGLDTFGVQFTSGSKVTGGRRKLNVPVARAYSSLYRALSTGRVHVAPEFAELVTRELASVSVGVTEAGRETYDVAGTSHHADTVSALAMAVTLAEQRGRFSQKIIAAAKREARERPSSGRRHRSNAARQVFEQRKEESRLEARRLGGTLWSPAGLPREFWIDNY